MGPDPFHRSGDGLATGAERVRALDAAVGRVFAERERLGIADSTMVVFTSDNGGERFADTWPQQRQRRELLEGGIRVPGIVRCPGRITPGSRSNPVVASIDGPPTLAGAVAAAVDAEFAPDVEDLLSVLTGRAQARAEGSSGASSGGPRQRIATGKGST